MNKLSVVIPVYCNELNLPQTYQTIKQILEQIPGSEYEIIFVDDGSRDRSHEILSEYAQSDTRCKVVKLSKNYGSHIAILAGFTYCTGDCAVMISADLQDPPELIPEMYEFWKKGHKSVLAVREDREEFFVSKLLSNFFYKLMKRYALAEIPEGGFDFFLIDRQIIDLITKMQEKNSHLMTQVLWTGFKPVVIPYKRKKREFGESMWTLSKKIKLFIDSFTAFSYLPLKLVSISGFIFAFIGLLYAIFIIFNRIFYSVPIAGWASLMVVLLAVSGVQLISIGIIGAYLWRNFDETRNRPIFIVENKLNF